MKENIQVTMGMDLQALRKAMEQAKNLVENTLSTMKKAFVGLAAVMGVAFGFKAIASGIGEVVRRGKDLDMLSRETGRSREEIALFAEQVNRAELSMADAADVLETWAGNVREAAIGTTELAMQLGTIGVKAADLAGLSLPEQFDLLATKINELRDPVLRANLAMSLFGSAGKKAVANYQTGDLQAAARLMGKNAMDLAAAAKTMAMINDAWSRIKKAGEVFFTSIATKLAPVMENIVARWEELMPKVKEWGDTVGKALLDAVTIFYNAFTGGELFSLLGTGLAVVWEASKSAFGAALMAGVAFLSEALRGIFNIETIGGALANGFVWAVAKLAEGLITAVHQFLSLFMAGIDYAIHKLPGQKSKTFSAAVGDAGNDLGAAGFDTAKKVFSDIASNAAAEAGKAFGNTNWAGMWAEVAEAGKDGWDANNAGLKEALAKWGAFVEKLRKPIEVSGKGGKGAGEGTKGGPINAGYGINAFDKFRRVGGGMQAGVVNIQQKMYDKLAEIAYSAAASAEGTKALVARATSGGGGRGGMELAGVR